MVEKSKKHLKIDELYGWIHSLEIINSRIWLGIDPGLSGGIAFVSECGKSRVLGTPVYSILKNNKNKKEYDISKMILAIRAVSSKKVVACQELTHAMPGNGNVSMYSFGRGHGLWEGIVRCHDIPVVFYNPQQWKKTYPTLQNFAKPTNSIEKQRNKTLAKKEAINLAKNMFLDSCNLIKNASDDGKAEALLIANHCRMIIQGQIS
jgi:hypothetical protein